MAGDDFLDFLDEEPQSSSNVKVKTTNGEKSLEVMLYERIVRDTRIDVIEIYLRNALALFDYMSEEKNVLYLKETIKEKGVDRIAIARRTYGRMVLDYYVEVYCLPQFMDIFGKKDYKPLDMSVVMNMVMLNESIARIIKNNT